MAAGRPAAGRAHGRGRGRARDARTEDGQAARRRGRPAARVGAFGCAVLDARDDGHRPQPRAQRRLGEGPREADEQRALRVRLVPPVRADVRQDRARRARRPVRGGAARPRRGEGALASRPSCRAADLAGLVETFKGIVQEGSRRRLPDRPDRSSSATRSKPCSSRGTAAARATTAGWSASPTISAPR